MKKSTLLARLLCYFFVAYMSLPASSWAQLNLSPPTFLNTNTVRITLSGANTNARYVILSAATLKTNIADWQRTSTGNVNQITFDLPWTTNQTVFYRANELPDPRTNANPFNFTAQPAVAAGSTARSDTVVLGGFTGMLTAIIPIGVTLFVNGVGQVGSTVAVRAGDVIWMQAATPGSAGVASSYTLTVGTYSATWNFTTGAIAPVPNQLGVESGYSPVTTSVSESGASQISLPIVVSPGTAGMQPKLALSYSSQGGNGPLGLGFSLGGLSTISRIGATVIEDGFKAGVAFNANDRFALDGQRLVAIAGADGGDGTEYRLEFDPTSRIRSRAGAGGNSLNWIVETKSGLTMDYGLSNYSRITPEAGGTNTLAWAVDRITDSTGNGMIFTYDPVAAQRGEMLVTRIAYTTRPPATTANQEVIFEYEDRPDNRTSYIRGFAMKMVKRLHALESRATDDTGTLRRVRRYTMTYQQDASTSDSELLNVQETRADGSVSPPTQFDWPASSADATYFLDGGSTGISSSSNVEGDFLMGDFDGDGRSDLLVWSAPGQANHFTLYRSTGFEFEVLPTSIGDINTRSQQVLFGDFNGDGMTDVLAWDQAASQYKLYFSTGTNFQSAIATGFPAGTGEHPHLTGDFNGDGRTDVLVWNHPTHANVYSCSLSQGTGFAAPSATGINAPLGKEKFCYLGEFNGDGMIDLLINSELGFYHLYTATGSGTFTPPAVTAVPVVFSGAANNANVVGDFNGDGLTDLMVWGAPMNPNGFTLYSCNGNGFAAPVSANIPGGQDGTSPHYQNVVDFNGDGRTDMITWNAPLNNSRYNIYTSIASNTELHGGPEKGASKGFFSSSLVVTLIAQNNSLNLVGDFNGDGRTDMLVWGYPEIGEFNLWLNEVAPSRLIQKVSNGHGGYTKFTYAPLSLDDFYSKTGGLNYPSYDLQGPLIVVQSVSSRNGIDGDAFTGAGAEVPGENTASYTYEGAWSSLDGRGFRGFLAIEITDQTTGIYTHNEFDRSSSLLGGHLVYAEQGLLDPVPGGSSLISVSSIDWNVVTTVRPGKPNTYFIHESATSHTNFETMRPEASAMIVSTTRYGPGPNGEILYDGFGNLLESTTETTTVEDGQTFSETIVNTYADAPTPTKWHLGRLTSSTVTKTAPGTPDLTRSSSFAYDPTTGLLTNETIEPGSSLLRLTKGYTHDGFGNILTSTLTAPGELSRTTTTTYTPDGRFVATTINALSHTESKTYDPLLGNVLAQTGPNGLTTQWDYDALGRPVRERRPDGTEARSAYRLVTAGTTGAPPRAVHYVISQSSGSAPRTAWYDILDREIRADAVSFDGRTVSAHKVFNARGQVIAASQPYFSGETPLYSTMLYDAVGRAIQQTDPGNRTSTMIPDGLTSVGINPKGQAMTNVVNAMGWRIRTTDHNGKSMTNRYDAYGSLRFVTDPVGNITEMRYNIRGQKTWMSESNSGISRFTNNAFGELIGQRDAKGQIVTLLHDQLGRVTQRNEPEGVTVFTYDVSAQGIGQLASESSPGFTRVYYYDFLTRPVASVESHGLNIFPASRNYDQYGRPDAIAYPTGFAARQNYNAYGHLASVQNATGNGPTYWSALNVNARGQITGEALGNGIQTTRTFDPETGLVQSIATGNGVQNEDYMFDLIGNLLQRRDLRQSAPFTEIFSYDRLNRLTNVTTTGSSSMEVRYNDIGNIISRSDVGNFVYGGPRPHAVTAITGLKAKTCAYDLNGNRTADGSNTISYSSFNKPIAITNGAGALRFNYGPNRDLFQQTITGSAGVATVRDYVGGIYERESTSDSLTRHTHYIVGGSGVVAIHTDERSPSSTAQRLRYLHKDHLGSVDTITDHTGAVVERLSFNAWGQRRTVIYTNGDWQVSYPAAATSTETHRGFTGHEMLDAVGLVHMNGRVYDPITASFLSPDPFVQSPDNLQSLNRYSYVLNNPLSYTDPSGFFLRGLARIFQRIANVLNIVASVLYFVPGFQGIAFALQIGTSFGSAFSGTLLSGGSIGDALRAGLRAGAITYASATVLSGASERFGWSGKAFANYSGREFAEKLAEKTITHGVIGGLSEVTNGGKFKHGFMSAAAAAAASPLIYQGTHDVPLGDAIGTIAAATVGGTVSHIGGGKFANGAISGAMGYIQNSLSDDIQETASALGSALVETIGNDASRALLNFSAGFIDTFAGEGWFQQNIVADGSAWAANPDSNFYSAGEAATLAVGGIGGRAVRAGPEIGIGGSRIAPLGNSGKGRFQWPHYHRRRPDPSSPVDSLPGQGIGRHRPWEGRANDRSFWDRF